MRHRKSGLKLGKTVSHRQSMFKNMVTSLFKHDRIKTTDVKAKELRRWADHVITLVKRGDLHARRQVLTIIRDKKLVHELFENGGQKFSDRSGGYTRITKVGRRPGDAAPVSIIELIGGGIAKKKGKDVKKEKKESSPTPTSQPVVESSEAPNTGAAMAESSEAASDSSEASVEQAAAATGDAAAPEASQEEISGNTAETEDKSEK